MAGDWIKMRGCLQTHPKVVRIASALCTDKFRVVGALHAVWCLFDAHTEDGKLDGFSADALDQLIGWPGFSFEMARVGWMQITPESLVLSQFSTHNGSSAKRRAQEADRKRNVRKASASDADKKRTREEKRREEKKKIKPMSSKLDESPPPIDPDSPEGLIEYLNGRVGKHFKPVDANLRLLRGRLAGGATAEEVRAVIDRQVREWRDTDMAKYLRPATLFNAEKFAQYAGELGGGGGDGRRDWWLTAGYGSEEAALRDGVRRAA